jgi:hypothetical protein
MERVDGVYIAPAETVSLADYRRYDGLEFMVGGDRSGGDYSSSADPAWNADEQRLNHNRSAGMRRSSRRRCRCGWSTRTPGASS